MASPAPIRPAASDVQAWRDALEAMKPTTPPCPSITGAKWEEMRVAAIDFLERFGDDAVALGWTATDLFGVHPAVGFVRVDYCGGLMINARRVEAIDLALIDGEHTNVAAFSDLFSVLPNLASDALVAFHDTNLVSDAIKNIQVYLSYSGVAHCLFFAGLCLDDCFKKQHRCGFWSIRATCFRRSCLYME